MQSNFEQPSELTDRHVLAVSSRDGELIATLQELAAHQPFQVVVNDNPEPTPVDASSGAAAVVTDRRSLLGLGAAVIGHPLPAPPVLAIVDGAEGAALEVLRRGAWDVMTAPFEARQLQAMLEPLLAEGLRRARYRRLMADFYQRVNALSAAEAEVMTAVCEGKLNKQIARELNVSIRTVEQRRRRVFTKMNVASAVPLARRVAEVRTLESVSRLATGEPLPAAPAGPAAEFRTAPRPPASPAALWTGPIAYGASTLNQPC